MLRPGWWVALEGERSILRELAMQFAAPELAIVEEPDIYPSTHPGRTSGLKPARAATSPKLFVKSTSSSTSGTSRFIAATRMS